jgi:hypothetical protein
MFIFNFIPKRKYAITTYRMQDYEYILLFFAVYIAVCSIFKYFSIPIPICPDAIFGKKVAFILQYFVFFAFMWWVANALYSYFIGKESFSNKRTSYAKDVLEEEQGDQSDKNTQYNEFLKNAVDIPNGGGFSNIPDGYYGITVNSKNSAGNVNSVKKMMPTKFMPDGCELSKTQEKGIKPISPSGNYNDDEAKCRTIFNTFGSSRKGMTYDANNLDSYATNKEKSGKEKEDLQKKFDVNIDLVQPPPIYYEPGSYTFGATGYIPDYERSVYLSKTTNESQVENISLDAPYLEGGFCKQYANSPQNMEQKCQSLDNQTCATTGCCVLLGGQKCVSGDSQGPKMKANYSDTQIENRDYYYYQGKCYGNCDSTKN